MRRFLLLLTISISAIAVVSAKDNVSDVQTKLKQGGFYFGEVNGTLNADLSAAITRYQIRNGLQITGNLNEETSKSLGVKSEVTASAPAPVPSGDTWRRLRKGDQSGAPGVASTKSGTSAAKTSPDSPTAALVPARRGDNSTFVLSRERLRDYVGAFVLAGLDPQVGAELEFFADRVHYYNDGIVDRPKIRADLQRYDARWPERRFWLAGDLKVEPQADSSLQVTFPLRFDLRNGSAHSSGKVQKMLRVEVTGQDLQIVAVDERKAR